MVHVTRSPEGTTASGASGTALEATAHAIESGRQLASEAAGAAQRRLEKAARATRRQLEDNPVKSVLIAASIGATAAALVMAVAYKRHDAD